MARVSAFVAKVRTLFAGRRADREFDQELEAHISLLSDRYVREGMTPDEARYAALRQFGRNGVRVHGIVMNNVQLDRGLGRRNAYHYQYTYE